MNHKSAPNKLADTLLAIGKMILLGSLLMLAFTFAIYLETSQGSTLQSLFQLDSVQLWWYVTRSAGLTGYFLIWLSMVWGFAVSSKIFHPAIDGSHSYDFHEYLSLLGLGFIATHIIVLMLDRYLPYSPLQILIPFTGSYRPLWVGTGIISLYLMLTVTITFYLRQQIGMAAFRSIHILSILGYLGATLHGLFAGTDSALLVTKGLYALTFLVVVFMTIYWAVLSLITKREKIQTERKLAAQKLTQPQKNQRARTPIKSAR